MSSLQLLEMVQSCCQIKYFLNKAAQGLKPIKSVNPIKSLTFSLRFLANSSNQCGLFFVEVAPEKYKKQIPGMHKAF